MIKRFSSQSRQLKAPQELADHFSSMRLNPEPNKLLSCAESCTLPPLIGSAYTANCHATSVEMHVIGLSSGCPEFR